MKTFTTELDSGITLVLRYFDNPVNNVLGVAYSDSTKYNDKIREDFKEVSLNVNAFDRGDYCGYVLLSRDHKLFEADYDEINQVILDKLDSSVHGGLTYSRLNGISELIPECKSEVEENWCVGFDTSHIDDTRAYWTFERFEEELNHLTELMKKL